MTDAELIARLDHWIKQEVLVLVDSDILPIRDRIEALTEQLAAARQDAKAAEDELEMQEQEACMMENDYLKLEKERDALEAKLAQAVEGQKVNALEQILEERGAVFDAMVDAAEDAAGKDVSFNVVVGRALRAAIAEIKGETK